MREFPKFAPVNMWFSFPVHTVDNTGVLSDVDPEDSKPLWQKAQDKKKLSAKEEKEQRKQEFELAIEACCMGEPPTKEDVATYLDISVKTVERRLRDTKRYIFDKNLGKIIKTDKDK